MQEGMKRYLYYYPNPNPKVEVVKWDDVCRCFTKGISSQVVKDYIKILVKYPNKKDIPCNVLYSFKYCDDILKVIERLDVTIESFNEWILNQIDNFNLGVLSISNIEQLKAIGFFDGTERFNDEDLKTIEAYFKNITDTRISKEDIKNGNWQLKIAKYFVMNYYHRKPNQQYELSDYINEIMVNVISYANENQSINIPALKKYILNKIKEYNEKNSNNEIDYIEETDTSYDNLMDNMEINEKLTYGLICLSVFEPRIYQTFCDYCGVKLEGNNIVSTSNDYKPIKDIASSANYSDTTVRKHIRVASNVLKNDSSFLGEKIIQQNKYVVELLKTIFLNHSMTTLNKRVLFFHVINLFEGKSYDDRLVQYIRTILNESNDDNLLQYKDAIEVKLIEIEQNHYRQGNSEKTNDSDQLEGSSSKHV